MVIPRQIWLWQSILSPHMSSFAVALVKLGCEVTYVAEQSMTDDRVRLGWTVPVLDGVAVHLMTSLEVIERLVTNASPDSIHLCSGVRANGMVFHAQRALARRKLRQWVVMETVDDAGWRGPFKRLEYRRLLRISRQQVQGVLAIGHRMPDWIAARGVPLDRIFSFAYFLPSADIVMPRREREPGPFRFVFAGRLVPFKRVDWLIDALTDLKYLTFELWIVGTGPEESALRVMAGNGLGDRVRWFGQLPMTDVPAVLSQADCLVLPSVHDGWGAVVSEALMSGTPVICSDACGSAGIVRASGLGGVFPCVDSKSLAGLLVQNLRKGTLSMADRRSLASWAECLDGEAGAAYFLQILDHAEGRRARPLPPWSLGIRVSNQGNYDEQ